MEAGKEVKRIPMTFGDALDALEADEVVKKRAAGRDVPCLHALQAGRVGALLRHRHRLGRDGVPGRAAVAAGSRRRMCGIAGIIYRDGSEHPIGDEMTRMLQSMKHRGPDSTGYALYGTPENGSLVMRYKLADANTPRDFEFEDRLRRHRVEVEARLAALGARDPRGRGGDAVRVPRLVRLRRRPEAPRRLRRGHPRGRGALARPLARDRQGPRRRRVRARAVRPRRRSRARTRSATCAWRPSPRSTSPARTRTGRTRTPTSRSSTTAS